MKKYGILIQYAYSGDETPWKAATEAFVAAIDADDRLRGRFSYQVNVLGDGVGRVHVGRWDDDETLSHLQAQPFFKTFSEAVQGFAGDSLNAAKFARSGGTVE